MTVSPTANPEFLAGDPRIGEFSNQLQWAIFWEWSSWLNDAAGAPSTNSSMSAPRPPWLETLLEREPLPGTRALLERARARWATGPQAVQEAERFADDYCACLFDFGKLSGKSDQDVERCLIDVLKHVGTGHVPASRKRDLLQHLPKLNKAGLAEFWWQAAQALLLWRKSHVATSVVPERGRGHSKLLQGLATLAPEIEWRGQIANHWLLARDPYEGDFFGQLLELCRECRIALDAARLEEAGLDEVPLATAAKLTPTGNARVRLQQAMDARWAADVKRNWPAAQLAAFEESLPEAAQAELLADERAAFNVEDAKYDNLPEYHQACLALAERLIDCLERAGTETALWRRTEQFIESLLQDGANEPSHYEVRIIGKADFDNVALRQYFVVCRSSQVDGIELRRRGFIVNRDHHPQAVREAHLDWPTPLGELAHRFRDLTLVQAESWCERQYLDQAASALEQATHNDQSSSLGEWWQAVTEESASAEQREALYAFWLGCQSAMVLAESGDNKAARLLTDLEKKRFSFPEMVAFDDASISLAANQSPAANLNPLLILPAASRSADESQSGRGLFLRGPDGRAASPAVWIRLQRSNQWPALLEALSIANELQTLDPWANQWREPYLALSQPASGGGVPTLIALVDFLNALLGVIKLNQEGKKSAFQKKYVALRQRLLTHLTIERKQTLLPALGPDGNVVESLPPLPIEVEWRVDQNAPRGTLLEFDRYALPGGRALWIVSSGPTPLPQGCAECLLLPHPKNLKISTEEVPLTFWQRTQQWHLDNRYEAESRREFDRFKTWLQISPGENWLNALIDESLTRHGEAHAIQQWQTIITAVCGARIYPKPGDRSTSWPLEGPYTDNQLWEYADVPVGETVGKVERYSVNAESARCKLSLGSDAKDALSRAKSLRKVRLFKDSRTLWRMFTAALQRRRGAELDDSLDDLAYSVAEELNRVVLPKFAELRSGDLSDLNTILRYFREWGQTFGIEFLPRTWEFRANPSASPETKAELENVEAEFSSEPANAMRLQAFGVTLESRILSPCRATISAGPEPRGFVRLRATIEGLAAPERETVLAYLSRLPSRRLAGQDDFVQLVVDIFGRAYEIFQVSESIPAVEDAKAALHEFVIGLGFELEEPECYEPQQENISFQIESTSNGLSRQLDRVLRPALRYQGQRRLLALVTLR